MEYINVSYIEQLIKDGKIKRIFLDYDCTMVNSIEAVLNQLNERYNTAYITEDCTTWNFSNLFPDLTEVELLEIFDSVRFFDEVKMYEGVWEFVNKHLDMITVVSKGLETNLYLKRKWINKYFPTIDFVGLEGTIMDKSMVNMGLGSLHIDDNEKNLWSTNSEYKILYENVPNTEWNSGWIDTPFPATEYEQRFIMNNWK